MSLDFVANGMVRLNSVSCVAAVGLRRSETRSGRLSRAAFADMGIDGGSEAGEHESLDAMAGKVQKESGDRRNWLDAGV